MPQDPKTPQQGGCPPQKRQEPKPIKPIRPVAAPKPPIPPKPKAYAFHSKPPLLRAPRSFQMTEDEISSSNFPIVTLGIKNVDAPDFVPIEAMLDSGSDFFMTISPQIKEALDLEIVGSTSVIVGDGARIDAPLVVLDVVLAGKYFPKVKAGVLGSLPTIGKAATANFAITILDNERQLVGLLG